MKNWKMKNWKLNNLMMSMILAKEGMSQRQLVLEHSVFVAAMLEGELPKF